MPRRLAPRSETPYEAAQADACREAIRDAWERAGRHGPRAAELLGISRSTLSREIRRLGLELPGYRSYATVA